MYDSGREQDWRTLIVRFSDLLAHALICVEDKGMESAAQKYRNQLRKV